ncbi:MAG: hypothetical protein ABW123_10540 [Cystobacter sp.]
MNWKKGQTTGFRAVALFAVLGATVVLAGPSGTGARVQAEAVALEEVVLVSKAATPERPLAGGPLGLLGGLLGGGGAGGSGGAGNLLGGLLGFAGLE